MYIKRMDDHLWPFGGGVNWYDSLEAMILFTLGFMGPDGPPVPSFLIGLKRTFL
jgi:hypothetical protein